MRTSNAGGRLAALAHLIRHGTQPASPSWNKFGDDVPLPLSQITLTLVQQFPSSYRASRRPLRPASQRPA